MHKGNLFYPKEYEQNDKIILKYFSNLKLIFFFMNCFSKPDDEKNLLH